MVRSQRWWTRFLQKYGLLAFAALYLFSPIDAIPDVSVPIPALYPRILAEGGRTVYDIAIPNPNATIEEGLVEYRKALEEARTLGRIGASPLVVQAKQIGGKYGADIVLSEEDARRVLEADSRGKFLGDAKVAVVID